jgi:hypothetical protein
MARIIPILLLILLSACRKSDPSCSTCSSGCSHMTGDISGDWKLEASRQYSAPNNLDPSWVPANAGVPVTISFTKDSIFTFNNNFSRSSENFDRYKFDDSAGFIYSTNPLNGNTPYHPAEIVLLNSKEIELIYMGVDDGTEEKYACY